MAAAAVCAAAPGSAAQAGGGGPRKEAAEDGESVADVARDVAELPARAQSSLGERATAAAPPRPRPQRTPRAGRARAQLPGSIRGSLTPCQLTLPGFRPSGVPCASSFNF